MDLKSAKAHLALELSRSKRAIAIERAAPLAAPLVIAAAFWAAFGLTGALDRLPPLAASILVIAALGILAWLGWRGLRGWRAPSAADARARLETDAHLDLGSLSAAEDRPARLDPDALALWRREQDRARERVAKARASRPRVRFGRADPLGLRFVAPIALLAGLIVAGADTPDRFARAFLPDPGPLLGDGPLLIEAWVTPAAYTGAGPIPLSDRSGAQARVVTPPQVEATVRVAGATGAPRLVFEGAGGRRTMVFARTADGAWEAKMPIASAGALKVVRFHTKARWRLAPSADQAPAIAYVSPPTLKGSRLTFAWEATDDYGVNGVALELEPLDPPVGLKGAAPLQIKLEAPPGAPRSARGEAEIEMAAHAYAGLSVRARLVATDALAQSGNSASETLALPPPTFNQPVARAAIEIRRAILWERRPYAAAGGLFAPADPPPIQRAPEGVRRAASLLDGLTVAPQDGYFPDLAVYAGLSFARAALGYANQIAETDQAADFLWHTAMRAEFGASADARKGLEQAQKALADAIRKGAGAEEVARLSDAVRRAMQQYLDALVAEAMREGKVAESQEDREEQASLGRQDLDELLAEVERLAQEGRTEEAMNLLAQIAGLLDGLEVRLVEGDGQSGQPQGDPKLNEAIEGLSGAMGEQRALRDQTEQADRDGKSPGDLSERQSDLAGALGEARKKIGEVGDEGVGGRDDNGGRAAAAEAGKAVDQAERAMREAADALRRGDLGDARQRQDEALSSLRSGAERLGQEQLRRDQNGQERGRRGQAGGARDPLGRSVRGGVGDGDEVGVPDRIDGERAREIRDELRRRAQDPRRPEAERDYLRRLLERFEGA